ncbi:YciI family protein [Paracoccus xiamenensis]|uniref:YciI family protein n=1 Tax=Paracoccus xiamenensis TaxID=2714901 RepID=UPI00140BE6FA|nr:YciI family protein [Paracoccus xiamenensis]NHF73724.1 YciI family protein [Paracoccus xiamenensis]
MPYFAVICRDKPDSLSLRMENREAHLAYARDSGVLFLGGPLIEDGQMAGSLAILDVADLAAAQDWAAHDPYGKAGLFQSVTINEWKRVIG